jgi:hypothetical protein
MSALFMRSLSHNSFLSLRLPNDVFLYDNKCSFFPFPEDPYFNEFLIEINWLYNKIIFGIGFAFYQIKGRKTYKAVDKAKPRAIVGRKTTGPIGIAGLPNRIKGTGLPWLGNQQSGFYFKLSFRMFS